MNEPETMQGEQRQQDQNGVVASENQRLVRFQHRTSFRALIGAITVVLVALLPQAFHNGGPAFFVLAYAVAAACWMASFRIPPEVSLPWLLVGAALVRVFFFTSEPELSGDVYRYLWDGRTAAAGVNPYAWAPAASPSMSRPVWFHSINHPEIPTIYPPMAELLFLINGWAHGGLAFWRLILLALDLITIRLLFTADRRAATLYAFCPLVLVEGFWSAHLEIAVTALTMGALMAVVQRRERLGALACALAIGVKLTPLTVFPVMIRTVRRRGRFMAITGGVVLGSFLPFIGKPLMPGMSTYASRWSFNSPVFAALRWSIEKTNLSDGFKNLFSAIKDSTGLAAYSGPIYQHLYPDFLTRVLLFALWIGGLSLLMRSRRPLLEVAAESFALLMLLSPTVHPWYLIPLLPMSMLAKRCELIALACFSPASYLFYASPSYQPLIYAVCYGLPLVIWLALKLRDCSLILSGR